MQNLLSHRSTLEDEGLHVSHVGNEGLRRPGKYPLIRKSDCVAGVNGSCSM